MELMEILKGEYVNPHVSIFYYKLDSIDEVGKPEMWLKANPNLGQTVSYETYQLDVERAENSPGARNDILAKRFNLPMEGYTYFFTYEETLRHRHRDFWQMPCAMGADLSLGDDFCSFDFLFPLENGYFGVKTRDYITSYTLSQLPLAMRQKYEEFMNEGTLQVFDGTVLDMMQVYDDLDAYMNDPMTATWFREDENTNKAGPRSGKSTASAVTSEVLYYDMVELGIPFECEKWHLNRLLTLIRVCNEKHKPPKKVSKSEQAARRKALNAKRKKELGTRG